jgi:hypothetical protein
MAVIGTLWIGDRDYTLDDLELGEVEEFETAMGGQTMAEVDLSSAKAIIWLVYLVKRREDPEYTLDDARSVKLTDIIRPEEDEAGAPLADAARGSDDGDGQTSDETGGSEPGTFGVPVS